MTRQSNNVNICTFTCRSVKNPVIAELCSMHDVVLLQEHWLLPAELPMLSNIHSDFHSYSLSAVDLSADILIGRPFGGTAILFRKSIADKVHVPH